MNSLLELAKKRGIKPTGSLFQRAQEQGISPIGTNTSFPTQEPENIKQGFFQRLTQGITNVPRRLGVQIYNAGVGIGKAATGDVAGGIAELDKERDLGYLGITKPTLTDSARPGVREILDVMGQGLEAGSFAVGGPGLKNVAQAGFKGMVKEGIKQGAKAGFAAGGIAGLGTSLQEDEQTIKNTLGDTALGAGIGTVGGGVFGGVLGGLGSAVQKFTSKLSGNFSKQADDAIELGIQKGIKPSVTGKKTPELYSKFMDRSKIAVKYIAENADELNLTDDAGTKIRYPKTLDQFSTAISKAKQNVYGKYNFLKKMAGEDEARVYLGGVSAQLRKTADNTALKLKHPEIVGYLQQLADRFDDQGFLGADDADQLIQLFNSELKAFYRNPNSSVANKMTIDAMVVNNIRKELDDVIQNASGQNYQALKNVYGALAELEKEVGHRTVVSNRANIKGLADLTDIFSAGQVVQGILTANPAQVATGVVQKGIALTYKALNNPNRIVAEMFKNVGKIVEQANKKGVKVTPSSPLKTIKALPAGVSPRGKQPSVNLEQINLPSKTQSTLDELEIARVKGRKPQTLKDVKNKVQSGSMKDPLIQEAKKYKSAEEFVKASQQADLMDLSNRSSHRIGRIFSESGDGGVQDLPAIVKQYGEDLKYTPDAKVPIIKSPNDTVTVYRSVPKGIKNIEAGDYVSFSKDYAAGHERGATISMKVPAKDVIWQGNDFNEWVYSPAEIRSKYKDLTDIWNKANKKTARKR